MNIFKFGWILIISFTLLLVLAVLFITLVPMNFYATAKGRLEPAETLRVSFAEDGIVNFLAPRRNFRKGAILASLCSEYEKKQLAGLREQKMLLQSELRIQIQKYALEKRKWQQEKEKCRINLEEVEQRVPMQAAQFKMFSAISHNLHTQKKLDEELKKQEAIIFESLFKRQLVAKLDFLKVLHDKKMAESMSEQAKIQTEEKLFNYKIELGKLEEEVKIRKLEKAFLELPLPPDAEQIRLELAIRKLNSEIAAVTEKIRERTFSAPYSGIILRYCINPGEFTAKGNTVMEIAKDSKAVFTVLIDQSARSDIKTGQKAEIYLDNYPFLRYGYLEGTLEDIQTGLGESGAQYLIRFSLPVAFDRFPPGLSGQVKIIIYHGTILDYLLRDNFNIQGTGYGRNEN
ncbi:MAG: HlyD family efflux transporter periplasmic adaptor subunit [Victivallaceae bacterium]|nr:HlyD family efflux transporter periplasmic adaptor subunit [Victivallaceae bacterium]